jgi:CRP/FNR family cyclic AMP-dependent transcriptional regulator
MEELALEPLETRVGLHPFLVGLRPHHIKLLADCAMAKSFAAGEYLFRQGEFANRFYLIEQGLVLLEALDTKGNCVAIEQVGAGKLVGWSWLFPPYIWHFDARAAEPTSALFFYGTILREYCAKDPSLGFELMKRMSQVMVERLQSARARLLTQYSGEAKAKKGSGDSRRASPGSTRKQKRPNERT